MKTRKIIPVLIAIFAFATTFAQAPQKMSYQAVIRGSNNAIIGNRNAGMKISILQGSPTGTVVFSEIHNSTTNANGLVTLEIGSGTEVIGKLEQINWANGPYYIKSETDPTGGNNYILSGEYQLLSVPYALFAYSAGTLNSHYIGELYGGGVIVSLWKDQLGEPHGLIASLNDIGSYIPTVCLDCLKEYQTSMKSLTNGKTNSLELLNNGSSWIPTQVPFQFSCCDSNGNSTTTYTQVTTSILTAAQMCANYSGGGFNDWYLPAVLEMEEMKSSLFKISDVIGDGGDFSGKLYITSTSSSSQNINPFGHSQFYTFDSADLYLTLNYLVNVASAVAQGTPYEIANLDLGGRYDKILVRAFRRF